MRRHPADRSPSRHVWSWLVGLCALVAGGCGEEEIPPPNSGSAGAAPERVVCASPAITEITFALGCADRVVGVSEYSTFPPEAKAKPVIGGWINPNRERLLVLAPDLILSQGVHETLTSFADEYGVRQHGVKLDDLEDVEAAIESIATVLQVPDRGTELVAELRESMDSVRERLKGVEPRRVLLLIGRTPGDLTGLATIGPGTFLDQLIELAGGMNIFHDASGDYPTVSKETLLVRRPEVILEVNADGLSLDGGERLVADWAVFGELPAVEEGRVFLLDEDYLLILGPRIGLTIERLARAIHPERFDE